MKLFWVCALVALVGLARAQDGDCPTEDQALEGNLADNDIFSTARFNENEVDLGDDVIATLAITEDLIKRQESGELAPTADLKTTIEAESKTDLAVEDAFIVPYFYTVCPYRWFKVDRYKYYFKMVQHTNEQVIYMYHWNYYPYWYTICATHYCRVRYDVVNWWDYRYRCFSEYRYVYVWMMKLTVVYNKNSDGSLTYVSHSWTRYLTRMRLPRGCCCRRYWRFKSVTSLQCPAGIQ